MEQKVANGLEPTIPKMIRKVSSQYPEIAAQMTKNAEGVFEPLSYREMYQLSLDFGASLIELGVKRGEPVGLIADDRKEWFHASIGIMGIGAHDVPRGCDATPVDLENILGYTECKISVAENSTQVNKLISLHEKLPLLKTIISFDAVKEDVVATAQEAGITIYTYEDRIAAGKKWRIDNPGKVEDEIEKGVPEETACIIFTSGTTGMPKGVELTQKNLMPQLDELRERIYLNPGENILCILPVWHVYMRAIEYVLTIQAATLCYSKPVGSIMLADIQKVNPVILPAVPRVWESVHDSIVNKMRKTGGIVYSMFKFFLKVGIIHGRMNRILFRQNPKFGNDYIVAKWILFVIPWLLLFPLKWLGDLLVFRKIRALLGKNFRAGIAGGGAYPKTLDEFYYAIGVNVCEGYGMTETAPVISVRPIAAPIFGTIGSPLRGMEARIVDPTDGFVLGRCKEGVLQLRGDMVMKGYLKRPDLTEKIISPDGWLDTGDLALMTLHDELIIKGRIKDTIVLRGGENIEPVPIEQKLKESIYVNNAVVVGQDQRYLAALLLVNEEEVKNFASENGIDYDTYENLLASENIQRLFENEVASRINAKNGFKMFERINKFKLITKPFEVGQELSGKQDLMRPRIYQIYDKEIKAMFE